MKKISLSAEEQDFLKIFSGLSEREAIEIFEDYIRNEQDDSVRQALQYLFLKFKEACRESSR